MTIEENKSFMELASFLSLSKYTVNLRHGADQGSCPALGACRATGSGSVARSTLIQ